MHQMYYLIKRGVDGIKRRPALHILSLLTLTATFLSFTTTLTAAVNIRHLVANWVKNAELTIYLEEGATEHDMKELADALKAIPQIAKVESMTPKGAKQQFAKQMLGYEEMVAALPDTTFPASIDVHLVENLVTDMEGRKALADRIEKVAMVEQVDLYDDWFSKLGAVATISQIASVGFGVLALVVALLVVSSVVKSSVNARAEEIEVLELVGATHRYIRFPFQLEGAVQTIFAMLLALMLHQLISSYFEESLSTLMPLIGMDSFKGLEFRALAALTLGAGMIGILGSGLSLKQFHEV